MNEFWGNFAIELAVLSGLGILYYFWQKKRILNYEENKLPILMGQVLQSCLMARGDRQNEKLDPLIEALDDYLQNKSQTPPIALLKMYASLPECDPDLKEIIHSAMQELQE